MDFHGYRMEKFQYKNREAIVVFPNKPNEKRTWALKTEYWDAFPETEILLLEAGFHLAFLKNDNRFATKADCLVKAEFIPFFSEKYGLSEKCALVGMSCGGAHAVNLAGYYPELVSCMFIDAPVLNFCSFPAVPKFASIWENEFVKAYPGVKRSDLLYFDDHPINRANTLIEHRIPILMVYGTEDLTVPFDDNGKLLCEAYGDSELLTVIKIVNRGHHPHGLIGSCKPIADYIIEHA